MQQATIYEVLQMAIHMEEEGQKFYEKYAVLADEEVKQILLKLAADEVQHIEYFQGLYNDLESKEGNDYFFNEEVIAFFKSYVTSAAFNRELRDISTVREAVEEGMLTERKTIHYYEQLAKFAEPELEVMLKRIIQEESKHAEILGKLLETL